MSGVAGLRHVLSWAQPGSSNLNEGACLRSEICGEHLTKGLADDM